MQRIKMDEVDFTPAEGVYITKKDAEALKFALIILTAFMGFCVVLWRFIKHL